ncbi:MAG TPA: ankyrin repeat domain-containing protein [Bryobacteraceae bacterium]|nr:ankyrin repeat domain-containing protein [Bryobacteraceae bacterium]
MSKEFFEAIRAGDRDKIDSLLASDAGLLSAKDENGRDPFTAAKYAGRNEIATMLLARGVPLDLFAACIAGAEQRVVELAAGAGKAAINGYSRDGWTPLHLACFFGHPTVAEALLVHGADVHAQSHNAMQNMPLHAAAAGKNCDAVRILIEHGADVNARQHGGWTAIHAAAQNGDVEMVRLLIASGADVQARAGNNQNALDLALTKGHQAVVNLLDEYAPQDRGA